MDADEALARELQREEVLSAQSQKRGALLDQLHGSMDKVVRVSSRAHTLFGTRNLWQHVRMARVP